MKTYLRIWPALFVAGHILAQSPAQELADAILQRWSAGSPEEFAAVYPFQEARGLHTDAVRQKIERARGISTVIHADAAGAVLLLSGVPLTGNSGDDTIYGMDFSGVYAARPQGGRWSLARQIPLADLGEIVSQRLKASVRPGHGIDVEDQLRVRVKGGDGFAARLNHQAKLQSVQTGRSEVRHQFGGGLLWVGLGQGEAELTLRYSLEVENAPKDTNSGCFKNDFGHIRNQYLWHPVFGFSGGGDEADFQAELRIPKEYGLTSSLPQTERIEGGERVVEARSVQKTFALTLAYDREWTVQNEKAGKVRLELLVTPGFRPDPNAVTEEFRKVHSLLAGRFGEPDSGYVAIVQLRAKSGNNWPFTSNQAVFAAGSPGSFSVKDVDPGANLGHEIGHLWTQGAGPAANFLREGWANYVESLVLEREYGRETMQLFWKQNARKYFQYYDGKASMWGSGNGSNLNYYKGSWVFRMLEDAVGSEAFQRAITEFSRRSLAGDAGWEALAESFQHQNVPEFDAPQFLLPWLKEKQAPHLAAQSEGRTVTIVQSGPVFQLPVTVEGRTAQGIERHRVWIRGSKAEVQFTDTVSDVRVDPDEVLLLRR